MHPENYTAELIANENAALAESPFWDNRTGQLVWADISNYAIWRTNIETGISEKQTLDQPIGCVAPYNEKGYVFAGGSGFYQIEEFGKEPTLIGRAFTNDVEKLNDGKIDQNGQFWAGSGCQDGQTGKGKLYCLDRGRKIHEIFGGVTASNGFDWSPDGRLFYYVDTAARGIDVFDVTPETGKLIHRRRFVDIAAELGLADGLTIDEEGCVWLAIWYAGTIHRYSPDGALIGQVSVPVCRTSSCVFGGTQMQTLFITTAKGRKNSPHPTENLAGAVFAVETNTRGQIRPGYLG